MTYAASSKHAAEQRSKGHPGERVYILRSRRGWTQQDLADAASVSLSTIKRIESGYDVRRQFLIAVADALQTTLAYLETRIE